MSLKSMTAFGSAELSTANTQYRCEIRTLNSRFCDISIKLPRSLLSLEPQLLALVKSHIQRGKVDVFFEITQLDKTAHLPRLNEAAIEHYLEISDSLKMMRPDLQPLTQYEILRMEGCLDSQGSVSGEAYIASHDEGIRSVIELALVQVNKQRASEGAVLQSALEKLVDAMNSDREAILQKREVIQTNLFESYKKRLSRLLGLLDETVPDLSKIIPDDRLLSELAILTDRADIEEELTRLKAHEDEFLRIMKTEDEAGRKLDFLCQEMHREVNTISNKLTQLDVATHSLTLKQTIERLKQQVQNIE
ncbi:MAG: YicC family protein [Proteobacteria bacterium]|nr:MAG: YicC family protein [Pseudomonadota bacterium]